MERKKSPWTKAVLKELIDRDMSIEELAKKIGRSRGWTSAVVHGRIHSVPAVKEISDALNIAETACSIGNDT